MRKIQTSNNSTTIQLSIVSIALECKVYYIDDATCETDHDGTPPTLIITKTRALFEKEFKKHQPHRELLASLQSLNEASDGGPSAKRIKTDNGGVFCSAKKRILLKINLLFLNSPFDCCFLTTLVKLKL